MNKLPTDPPHAVELKHVSKTYPGSPPVEALSDISISVARGEFLAIVGASGSGNSTLLHVIGTLTRPSSGSVLIDGRDTAGMSDRASIKKMQADLGLVATGRIAFGDIIFLPGTSVVESSSSFPNLGTTVNPGTSLVSLTPTERIETQIGQDGITSTTSESLQRVKTSVEVADQDLIDVGSEVKIELPDERVVPGTVREIGSIAVIPQGAAGNPYLEVSVAIDGNTSLPEWTGAPVTVSITKKLANNVLAAPVTSLLALLGGGYALEVLDQESTRLVPVEVGIYADGWVEVNGAGLEAGTEVVVPR